MTEESISASATVDAAAQDVHLAEIATSTRSGRS